MIDFEEIAVLDKNAQYLGVPTVTLMENAGAAVAKVAQEKHKKDLSSAAIFCGLGNNGGDGMVAARYLAYDSKCYVCLYLLGSPGEIRTVIASEQFNRLPKNVEVVLLEKPDNKTIKKLDVSGYTVIIDAMLGVGISGKLKEPYREIVTLINSTQNPSKKVKEKKTGRKGSSGSVSSKPTIISVDVPTGLGTDSSVKPEITVTFHDSKRGMTKNNSGKIIIRDIEIPEEAGRYVGPGELTFIPSLKQFSHKGDHGRLLIIGGGPYTGAPALVGLSALRTGVDLVHIATPHRISNTVASFSPNFIVHPLLQDSNYLTEFDANLILSLLDEYAINTIVIGPGLGRAKETLNAINKVIQELPKKIPILIDADAFSALAKSKNLINLLKEHTGVLTPHHGEFNKLLSAMKGSTKKSGSKKAKKGKIITPDEVEDFKISENILKLQEVTKQFAGKLGSNWTVLLKGPIDVISDGTRIRLNRTGNPGMTVGGTGDVLAGITGALLALGLEPFKAARAAAFINGYSGDLAWDKFGNGLTATDIIELIPQCLKDNLDQGY